MRTLFFLLVTAIAVNSQSAFELCSTAIDSCGYATCSWQAASSVLRSASGSYHIEIKSYDPLSGTYRLHVTLHHSKTSGEVRAIQLTEPYATHNNTDGVYFNCGNGSKTLAYDTGESLFIPLNATSPAPLSFDVAGALGLTAALGKQYSSYINNCDHYYWPSNCTYLGVPTNVYVSQQYIFPRRWSIVSAHSPFMLNDGLLTATYKKKTLLTAVCDSCLTLTDHEILTDCDETFLNGKLLKPRTKRRFALPRGGVVTGVENGTIYTSSQDRIYEPGTAGQKVMRFFWDYMIWFFVVAGLACVIGFLAPILAWLTLGYRAATVWVVVIKTLFILCSLAFYALIGFFYLSYCAASKLIKGKDGKTTKTHPCLKCVDEGRPNDCIHNPGWFSELSYYMWSHMPGTGIQTIVVAMTTGIIIIIATNSMLVFIPGAKADCYLELETPTVNQYRCAISDTIEATLDNTTDTVSFKLSHSWGLTNTTLNSYYFADKKCTNNVCNSETSLPGFTTIEYGYDGLVGVTSVCAPNATWKIFTVTGAEAQCISIPAAGGIYGVVGEWSGPYVTGYAFENGIGSTTFNEGSFTQVSTLIQASMVKVAKQKVSGMIMNLPPSQGGGLTVVTTSSLPPGVATIALKHLRCAMNALSGQASAIAEDCTDGIMDGISSSNLDVRPSGCDKGSITTYANSFIKLTSSSLTTLGANCLSAPALELNMFGWNMSNYVPCSGRTWASQAAFKAAIDAAPPVALAANFTCPESAYDQEIRISVPTGTTITTSACQWKTFTMSFTTVGSSTYLHTDGIAGNPGGFFTITCPNALTSIITVPCGSGPSDFLVTGVVANQNCYTHALGQMITITGTIQTVQAIEAANQGTDQENDFINGAQPSNKTAFRVTMSCSGAMCILNKIGIAVLGCLSWLWPSCYSALWSNLPGISTGCELFRILGYLLWVAAIMVFLWMCSLVYNNVKKNNKNVKTN